MASEKIFVTGANGQLGRELRALEAEKTTGFNFFFYDRAAFPVEDPDAAKAFLSREKPQWLINCAAYTAVDKAESEKETAFEINGDAPGYLAAACRRTGTRFIHVSTDYVFDGQSSTPLKETDPTGPINTYGASKLEGERLAMGAYPEGSMILRTSWVYSAFGSNFVKTMIRLMRERPAINVVDDQIGSPTYAADLADAILRVVQRCAAGGSTGVPVGPFAPGQPMMGSFTPGIFHYSNEGAISWYDFAVAIRDAIGSACVVHPIPTAQYPTPAKRPHYSLLDKRRIRETYDIEIPAWRTSLLACLRQIGVLSSGKFS